METLKLLDFVDSIFKDVNLNKVLLIASQHILGAQKTMFEYFIKKGLKPSNMYLIGKCYSTNKDVLKEIKKMGIYVSDKSDSFDSYLSFDEQFEDYTKDFLEHIKNKVDVKDYEKVIILEDGGSLLLHAKKIFEDVKNFVGIEQTSAGYERLKNIKLGFPVINVARSKAKLEIESPIIAKICIERLLIQLKNLKIKPGRTLIIGAGAIGQAIHQKLNDHFDVKRYDLNSINSDYTNESLKSIINEFDIIIGCTGKEVLDVSLYKYLKKNCILVSASSSDREFLAVNLRKMADKVSNCHDNILTNDLILLNGGFPINFDGKRDSAKPEDIQITLALLFASVCLAKTKKFTNGLIDIDEAVQRKIVENFTKK